MSFWKLPKTFAPPPTEGINGVLSPLTALDTPSDSSIPPSLLSQSQLSAHQQALDALLDEPDLLSEIKTGSNQRLTDFLARKEVVLRLGGWVVWGLGRGFIDESAAESGDSGEVKDSLGSGVLPDGLERGKVPDEVLQAAEQERKGMGGVPRRRDVDASGKFKEGDPDNETEQEKKWSNYSRLCTEILVANSPNLSETLFRPETASSQPHASPSPESFLLPFWESILGSTELQLASRAQHVGYWAKVNSFLLDGPMGCEVLSHILKIPHLPPRLLALLPFCSPINDLLLLLLRVSRAPSPLIPSTVTQTIRMLDPFSALGKPGHAAAEELLRGIIEICLAVPRPQGGMPGGANGGFGGPGLGGAGANAAGEDPIFEWRDTTLARQIADERSVRTLLDWMLAGLDEDREAIEEPEAEPSEAMDNAAQSGEDGGQSPPQPASPITPIAKDDAATPTGGGHPAPVDTTSEVDEAAQKRDLRTSSLVASIAVLVELIRKNNSDFVEQQMLAWARRREAAQAEREMLEAEGAEVLPLPGREGSEAGDEDDRGPSVVDLGGMLTVVAEHISGLQKLVKAPRSSITPVPTVSGIRSPLTLERFRICEFYAELLHCSNMSLVNRPDRSSQLYTPSGHLTHGWQAAEDLAQALAGPTLPAEELDVPRTPTSPDFHAGKSAFSASPNGVAESTSSDVATPTLEAVGGDVSDNPRSEADEAAAQPPSATEGEPEKADGEDKEANADDKEKEPQAPSVGVVNGQPTESATTEEQKRFSHASIGTTFSFERDLPATPSIYSVASRQLPPVPLAPGPLLKTKFIEHNVIATMLELFFSHPWNNFLHNVVFDLLQQVFHGRLDRPLDYHLAVSVFNDARLCERLLDGQKRNDDAAAARVNMRLGYMGHLSLIAEETVKLFDRYPGLRAVVEPSIPQPEWDNFVKTTLRDTRERDLTPLDGAAAALGLTFNQAPSSSSLSDDDDEFPVNSARSMRATEAAGMAGGGAAVDEGPFGGHGKEGGLSMGGTSDPFSRYLADALSSDRNVGSSDEDEEDETWLGGNRVNTGDSDFDLGSSDRPQPPFGFDDRFEAVDASAFGSNGTNGDFDDDWPPASGSANDAFASDSFTPTVVSSSSASNGGFATSFPSSFDPPFPPGSTTGEGEDDFGDFEGGDEGPTSITLPTMETFEDFDFGAFKHDQPSFGGATTEATDDGSSRFGRLSIGESDPSSPAEGPPLPLPPIDLALASSVAGVGAGTADAATSPSAPLGPAVHEGAHLAEDGFVEAEIEGKTVRVPADDIILAHRRNSLESSRRPSFEGVPQATTGAVEKTDT
ncbi:hypothetical protein JCM11641_005470 [Rhodosporidiobolus odoratus]